MAENTEIRWSKEHLAKLEQLFPEVVSEVDTNTILINVGTRKVILAVRDLIKAQETRLVRNR